MKLNIICIKVHNKPNQTAKKLEILTDYTRKPCYRKENCAMRPVYGCPEKFRESLAMPTAAFPEIVNWLLL